MRELEESEDIMQKWDSNPKNKVLRSLRDGERGYRAFRERSCGGG